jgi:hypothetical protein
MAESAAHPSRGSARTRLKVPPSLNDELAVRYLARRRRGGGRRRRRRRRGGRREKGERNTRRIR